MSIKNNDNTSVIKYLEFKQAPYIGRVYKKRFPLGKRLIYMKKLCENHEENELRLLKATLDAELENRKFFSPVQVIYGTLSAGFFTFFLSIFGVFNVSINSSVRFLSGSFIDTVEKQDKQMALEGLSEIFVIMFEEIMRVGGYIGIAFIIIFSYVVTSMRNQMVRFNKVSSYKSIIDQCIEMKIKNNL
ncbi:hypothetical protein ACQCVP_11900 [Rossellomorea vietnamensis]|uniref:hypothetical protein n=1 Tax=Rossellomorea vietnamensis TaxID=218284 RepID=UPI003CF2E389